MSLIRFRFKRIRSRLLGTLIFPLTGVVVLSALVWKFSIEPALQMGVVKNQQEIAQRAADQIRQFIDERTSGLIAAAEIGRLWEANKEQQKEALYRLLKLDRQIDQISVVEGSGQEIIRLSRSHVYTDADLASLASEEKFQQAIQGKVYISRVYYARTAEPFITLAVPIKFTATKIKGVLVAEVSLKTLWDSIAYIKVGKSGHAYVVNSKGILIAHPDYSKVLLEMDMGRLQKVKEFLSEPDGEQHFGEVVIGEGSKRVMSTFARVKGLNWAVFVEEPVDTALAEVKQVERLAILFFCLILVGTVVVSCFFSERIARPVRELERGAKLIAEGNLEYKLEISTGDEIEGLANQFNHMAGELKASYQGLEHKIGERTRDLSALYAAMAPLVSTDAHELVEQIVERLKEATQADAALIRIFDKKTQSYLYPAGVGFPPSYLEATRKVEPDSAIGMSFNSGEPIIVASIREDSRLKGKKQLEAGFTSCAFLPLRVSGELRGIIHLASRTAGHFNDEKKEHLMAIARQMGVAMENSELYEEASKTSQEQQVLREFLSKLLLVDLNELFQTMTEQAALLFRAEYARVRLIDRDGKVKTRAIAGDKEIINRMAVTGERGELVGRSRQILNSRKPVAIKDMAQEVTGRLSRGVKAGLHGSLGAPLLGRDQQPLGLIQIMTHSLGDFTQRDFDLIEQFAQGAAIAIENARLFEETEHRAKEQEALNVIAKATSQSLHRDELLEIALNKVLEMMGRERVSIRLKDPVTGAVQLVAHRGFSQVEVEDLLRRLPHKASDRVFATGQPLVVNNPAEIHDSQSLLPQSYAVAWIPIKAGAKVLGVLGVAAGRPIPFTQREVDLLQAVGNVIGVALENAGLFEETQRNLSRIQALREIDQAISSTLNLRQALDVLLEKIEVFLPYVSATTIRLFNKRSGKIEPITCRNLDEEEWKAEPWKVGRGSPNIVFESGRPVTVLDIQTDPRTKDPEFFRRHGLISYLGVPLTVQGEVLGVLSFYAKERHAFSEQEIDFLSTLAGQASIAIHNSQLYEEAERRRREAVELARLAQSLTETLDMTAVGERIVTSVRDLLNVKASTLRLVEPDGSLRALASIGEAFSRSPEGQTLSSDKGLTSRAVLGGRPMWSADMLSDPEIRLTDQMQDYQLQSGNRSLIAVPLRGHEKIIGALTLLDQTGRTYSDNEVALVQTFADQAALALENARLFEEVKQKIEELQQKTSELEQANKAKGEFLSVMSHELRTPLNVVLGYSAMLKEGILGEVNSKQQEALGKVLARANDQLQMINSILQATQIEAGAVRVTSEEVRLHEFFDEMRSAYELPINKEVTLEWHYATDLPVIKTDGGKLKHIVQNVINNAIKFTEKGRVTISVQHRLEPNVIEVKVADTGVGISRTMQPIIFEMFRQADSSENRPFEGVGLGLYIVKKLTELLGGKVEVESEEGEGSTFIVTIPCDDLPEKGDGVPYNIHAQPDYLNRDF